MASSVFYKFKSQREESRVSFDGTGISVFDLKKEIILANNLNKANDFDLVVCDSSSGEGVWFRSVCCRVDDLRRVEFKDDSHIIPRSSSVLVKRVFVRPGKGKAAMYVGTSGPMSGSDSSKPGGATSAPSSWQRGAGNISKRFDGKLEKDAPSIFQSTPPVSAKSAVTEGDEAAAMAAMFQAQTANWEETQEKMSQLVSRLRGFPVYVVQLLFVFTAILVVAPRKAEVVGPFNIISQSVRYPQVMFVTVADKKVCVSSGVRLMNFSLFQGHWIQDCPTNNDREYDNRPRIKRTTGIPRSFLKAVESPNGQLGQGVMVTPEGGYVVVQPDVASWQKQVTKNKGLTEADVRERTPTDSSLACPIDNKIFRDAVKTPCCGTLYCEECVQTHLLERDFACPKCGARIASLDKLIVDKPMRTKVGDFIDKEMERSRLAATEDELKMNGAPELSTAIKQKQPQNSNSNELAAFDQDYYSEQQPSGDLDMSQIFAETIPQLQAQISQIQVMLNNPSLPPAARQQTHMKYEQLQMQLQQAQVAAAMAATLQSAAASGSAMPFNNMQGYQQDFRSAWTNPFPNQQPAGQESAYQRLPLNNRRRNLKRDRPSDFLEIGGNEHDAKMPRYWE
ncbi:uncharacterized protein FIBRA_03877 [Fibroporia radiculosa]|uniref:DWNN domain-containing protein n=1 Tax=Fibroporia radiculosa TaxID=599839 RepID=J4H2N0_9APHY|nr:uncharacterized protein FIBRA_03877 [Fibroporia radiculosa]CCM01809.1 predicted protein [Fibroporia radiculosa]